MADEHYAQLMKEFAGSSLQDWEKEAARSTATTNPLASLQWLSADDIPFTPYYHGYNEEDRRISSIADVPAPSRCRNIAWVTVKDELRANQAAIGHLLNGADGILFHCPTGKTPRLTTLLQDIRLDGCEVSFLSPCNDNLPASFLPYAEHQEGPPLATYFYWDALRAPDQAQIDRMAQSTNIHPDAFVVGTVGGHVKQLVQFLTQARERMLRATSQPLEMAVMVPVGPVLLLEVAKFRALRILWRQGQEVLGAATASLHIHARTGPHTAKIEDILLQNTYAATAAILGGCDAVSVESGEEGNLLFEQTARAILPILRKEARLDAVRDAVGGSYFVDHATAVFVRTAWDAFRKTKAPEATP